MTSKTQIFVCTNLRHAGASCAGRVEGGLAVLKALEAAAAGAGDTLEVKRSVCMGYCDVGPNVKILGGPYVHGAKPEDAPDIIAQALALTKDKAP